MPAPHAHHHLPATGRWLWLATGLTLAYAVVEAGVGWWAGSLALLILVAWIAVSAVQRLHEPQPVIGEAVSVAAAIGLGINLLVAWLLSRGSAISMCARRCCMSWATCSVRSWVTPHNGPSPHDHPYEHSTT